jgi:hypothetical protein
LSMIFPDHARGQPSVAAAFLDDDLVVRLFALFPDDGCARAARPRAR